MQEENKTLITPEGFTIKFYNRESVEVSLNISKDTFEVLATIGEKKGLSVESVIKFFIGKGLRETEPELSAELAVKRFKSRKGSEATTSETDLAA